MFKPCASSSSNRPEAYHERKSFRYGGGTSFFYSIGIKSSVRFYQESIEKLAQATIFFYIENSSETVTAAVFR